MKKRSILIITLSIFIVLISSANACISLPRLELKVMIDPEILLMFEYYNNETAVLDQLNEINNQCNCLTDDDISIIKDYVVNGYSIKEQTDEEYNLFLEEAKQANEGRPEDCLDYEAVSHRDKWTGYIKTGYFYSEESGCLAPLCAGSPTVNIVWNDLVYTSPIISYLYFIIPLIVIIILLIILKSKKK